MISPQREYESYFRVYSTIKGIRDIENIYFWGAFKTEREATREKIGAEDAVFVSWIVTGELLEYEEELISYRRANSIENWYSL